MEDAADNISWGGAGDDGTAGANTAWFDSGNAVANDPGDTADVDADVPHSVPSVFAPTGL